MKAVSMQQRQRVVHELPSLFGMCLQRRWDPGLGGNEDTLGVSRRPIRSVCCLPLHHPRNEREEIESDSHKLKLDTFLRD